MRAATMTMEEIVETRPPTARSTVRRKGDRGVYDRDTINAILDEALICHVGFVSDDGPVVIPTIHARVGDRLVLHGSPASRMLKTLSGGSDVSVCVTLVDGLVLARSVFHHSMNYRSVVVHGKAEAVTEPAEKLDALRAVVEHIVPGRWDEARRPNEDELRKTLILSIPLDEASAKIRTGPPIDDEADLALDIRAGVIPLRFIADALVPDARA